MKVLLVGNYQGDKQWSMDRFGEMLLRGLKNEGIETEMVRPSVVFGRFFRKSRGVNKWLGYVDKFILFRPVLWRVVKARKGWVVHIVDQGNGIYVGWIPGSVVTCHDLLAIRVARGEFPRQRTGWSGRIFQALILRGLRKAARIACISEATRSDARRLIGESEIIGNGVEDFWSPVDAEESREEYLLHVGGDHWYKNRADVVRLFIDLRKNTAHAPKLIMVGPNLDAEVAAELKEAGLEGEVTVLKSISDETLRTLYSKARVLIFPSLDEGAGWPILEAQACGCPVVTTDKEPMRETGGDAAIYALEGEWAKAVAEALEMDETRRAAIVAAGMKNAQRYSVAKMVREYLDFYKRGFDSGGEV